MMTMTDKKIDTTYVEMQKDSVVDNVKKRIDELQTAKNKYAFFIIARNNGDYTDSKFAYMENDYLAGIKEAENDLAEAFADTTPFFQFPTNFKNPQDPPAWAYIEPRDGVTSPLDFKLIAWMTTDGHKDDEFWNVDLCFIGGDPIKLDGFKQAEAIKMVQSWEDYRVGKPILATKGNPNDR